ncbi:MAG: hypothetical protein R3254_00285 [Thiomicrorhabdus sp.]|nr:hypothetical protein [Thiomicrorhabdus sp.]
MKKLFTVLMLSLAFSTQAQTLNSQQFENQWEKPVELNAEIKWAIITQVKDAGEIVKQTFSALELADLQPYKLIYIADISGMPGFITNMFAIPKMRDYAFPIALIRDEGQLAQMQLAETDKESVVVLQLNELQVVDSKTFKDEATFKAFLQNNIMSSVAK